MTSTLPTIQLDNIFVDLNRTRTVLLAGTGGQLPVEAWLRECGHDLSRGATLPGIHIATASVWDYAEVLTGLPLDRPAMVHLADEDYERIDVSLALKLLPANAALIVTISDAEADDLRFSAYARFDEYLVGVQYGAQLREHRNFLYWSELRPGADHLSEREPQLWA